MTPSPKSLLQKFTDAAKSFATKDYEGAMSARKPIITDFLTPDLIAAMAAVSPANHEFWTEVLGMEGVIYMAMFPKIMYVPSSYQAIPELLAPIVASYNAAVKSALSQDKFTELLNQHITVTGRYIHANHPETPSATASLTRLASRISTRPELEEALAWNNSMYNAQIVTHAPILQDPDATTWVMAYGHGIRRGYTSSLSHLCTDSLLAMFLSNPHLSIESKVRLRDTFAMQYIINNYVPSDNLALLSSLNKEVLSAGHPIPHAIEAILLIHTVQGDHATGALAASLDLGTPQIVKAHQSRATLDKQFLPSLAHLSSYLSGAAWLEMVLNIIAPRDNSVADNLAIAVNNMPIGCLSAILPQFLEKVVPRALPSIAPVTAPEDWSLIIDFYKKRSHAAVQKSLLEFVERTTPEVRSLMPKAMLLSAFKSADASIRSRAFAIIGTLSPSSQTSMRL